MNVFLKIIFFCFVSMLPFAFFSWQKYSIQRRNEILVVGVSCIGNPYASLNKQGNLEGFDIDLSHKIAQKLGKGIEFRDMPLELLRATLKTGDIDLIGFPLIMTPKELEQMDMIDIYGKPKAEITCVFWEYIPQIKKPYGEGIGIGLKKGNAAFYNQIKSIIYELKKSGEIKALLFIGLEKMSNN
jgi:ABC-type amino acid transport substrate-binding protein